MKGNFKVFFLLFLCCKNSYKSGELDNSISQLIAPIIEETYLKSGHQIFKGIYTLKHSSICYTEFYELRRILHLISIERKKYNGYFFVDLIPILIQRSEFSSTSVKDLEMNEIIRLTKPYIMKYEDPPPTWQGKFILLILREGLVSISVLQIQYLIMARNYLELNFLII